jgi:hypothetical protein
MYIFGGFNGNKKQLNDTWKFSLENKKWINIETKGDIPTPR